jgi:hypothetical protein
MRAAAICRLPLFGIVTPRLMSAGAGLPTAPSVLICALTVMVAVSLNGG